jgi:hypothetical protein
LRCGIWFNILFSAFKKLNIILVIVNKQLAPTFDEWSQLGLHANHLKRVQEFQSDARSTAI